MHAVYLHILKCEICVSYEFMFFFVLNGEMLNIFFWVLFGSLLSFSLEIPNFSLLLFWNPKKVWNIRGAKKIKHNIWPLPRYPYAWSPMWDTNMVNHFFQHTVCVCVCVSACALTYSSTLKLNVEKKLMQTTTSMMANRKRESENLWMMTNANHIPKMISFPTNFRKNTHVYNTLT